MIGPVTSRIAFTVASRGLRPASMLRSTFSTTTMASSTHDPDRQHQAEQRKIVDREAAQQHRRERADNGNRHGQQGDDEARQVCRNRITTSTTSATASSRVWITACIESRTKMVGHRRWNNPPGREFFFSCSIVART